MRHLLTSAALLLSAGACAMRPFPEAAAPVPPAPVPVVAVPASPAPRPVGPVAVAAPVVSVTPPVVVGSPSPGVAQIAVPALGIALNLPAVPNPVESFLPEPSPGRLTLSNFSFDHAHVETVLTASNDCYIRSPEDIEATFELPLNGTRIVSAPPGRDVCWRRRLEPGTGSVGITPGWTNWDRAFVAYGTAVNSKL